MVPTELQRPHQPTTVAVLCRASGTSQPRAAAYPRDAALTAYGGFPLKIRSTGIVPAWPVCGSRDKSSSAAFVAWNWANSIVT